MDNKVSIDIDEEMQQLDEDNMKEREAIRSRFYRQWVVDDLDSDIMYLEDPMEEPWMPAVWPLGELTYTDHEKENLTGADSTQVAENPDLENSYTVHVTNVPESIKKESIDGLLRRYGKAIRFIMRPEKDSNTQEIFVTYPTYAAAENTVKYLTGVYPFGSNMKFLNKNTGSKTEADLEDKPAL